MDMVRDAEKLLQACNTARGGGKDFPTIWNEVLRGSPLILGGPEQHYDGAGVQLRIRLANGQALIFSNGEFELA